MSHEDKGLSVVQRAVKKANEDIPTKPMTEGDCSLWNDPRWGRARESMGEEAEEHYKTIGEQFNGSIDYNTGISNEIPIPALDSIAYITTAIKSGLTDQDLDDEEKDLMVEYAGKEWYKRLLASLENIHDDEGGGKCANE